MARRARRSGVAAAAATIGAGVAVYAAHRGTQRLLRGLVDASPAVFVPPVPIPEVGYPGVPGTPTSNDPGPGVHDGIDALLWHIEHGFQLETQFLVQAKTNLEHGIEWALDQVHLPDVDLEVGLSAALDAFEAYFGLDASWGTAFLQGAIDTLANLLGIGTAEAIHAIANWTANGFRSLQKNVDGLWTTVDYAITNPYRLFEQAGELASQLVAHAMAATYGAIIDLRAELIGVMSGVQSQVLGIENYVTTIPQYIAGALEATIPQIIPEVVELTMPLIQPLVQDLVNAATDAQTIAITAAIGAELLTLTEAIAAEEVCCATNTDQLNKWRPNMSALEDLLAALAVGFGLYNADELVRQVEDFISGGGADVGAMLAGWLEGKVDPATIAGSVF